MPPEAAEIAGRRKVSAMEKETALRLDVAALTDIGCKRTNNEDSFGYDLESRLFVVCDGMGGRAAETSVVPMPRRSSDVCAIR